MDLIITLLIVGVALFWFIRRSLRRLRGQQGCDCSACPEKQRCSSANQELILRDKTDN